MPTLTKETTAILDTTVAPSATMPNGLQATDEGLWVIDQATEEIRLLGDDLKPIRTLQSPTENASGITVGGGYFWTGSNAPAQARYRRPGDTGGSAILKCEMETGRLVERFPTPDGGGIHGLEWVDGLLWITAFRPKAMTLVGPKDFRVIKTVEVPYDRPHGLAWDGDGMWMSHTGLVAHREVPRRNRRGAGQHPIRGGCTGASWPHEVERRAVELRCQLACPCPSRRSVLQPDRHLRP